ncbi:hypothetical protein ACFXAZ_23230 [Streptomyces sp. NPDC059477]|uniref:hypothetical protein n=1 Tax=Streptomyces sp. NPDC059477 TaxID=3346847 RepID=UPI0036A314C5
MALLEAGSGALLAGYCHYLPFQPGSDGGLLPDPSLDDAGLGRSVLLAFAAGLSACDRVLVHSDTAASWVWAAVTGAGVDLTGRMRVVPPPCDCCRIVRDPASSGATALVGDRPGAAPIGVCHHRLYARYGTARFVDLARELTVSGTVRVRVMDLFGQRRAGRTGPDDSPERMRKALAALPHVQVVSDRGDRVRYRQLLAGSRFGIAPFRPACPWSMSVVDCQGMGLPVIAPRMGWFAEHIDPALCFTTAAEAVALAVRSRAMTPSMPNTPAARTRPPPVSPRRPSPPRCSPSRRRPTGLAVRHRYRVL